MKEPVQEGSTIESSPHPTEEGLLSSVRNARLVPPFQAKDSTQPRVDYERLVALGHELLSALGEDPFRAGIVDTPRRWAQWWKEFIEYEPGTIETTFDVVSEGQLICVAGIIVWSLCEHHLLPFQCEIAIGYVPESKILGASKFARIAQQYAHRLQLQERMVDQIAAEVARITETENVIVLGNGQHICMDARGVKTPGRMHSLAARGAFQESAQRRQEFLQLAGHRV